MRALPFILVLAVAGCDHVKAGSDDAGATGSSDQGASDGAPASFDATGSDGSAEDAATPVDDAAADAAMPVDLAASLVPAALIGNIQMAGTCDDDYKGWTLDNADRCVAQNGASMGQASTRAVTLSLDGSAVDANTYFLTDELNNTPTQFYTAELSPVPPVTVTNGDSCDPVYGRCVKHTWTLGPSSLTLVTDLLHDNYSPFAIAQCWMYSYHHNVCTYSVTW